MNETPGKKGLSQPVLILVVLVILAAIGLVVILGTSKKAGNTNGSQTNQVANTNEPINVANTNVNTSSSTNDGGGSLLYRNNQYGFTITLSKDYEGYVVTEKDGFESGSKSLSFLVDATGTNWVSSSFSVFSITVHPAIWWEDNVVLRDGFAWYKNEDVPAIGSYLGKNDQYAYSWTRGHDCPSTKPDNQLTTVQCKLYEHAGNVLTSFQLIQQ